MGYHFGARGDPETLAKVHVFEPWQAFFNLVGNKIRKRAPPGFKRKHSERYFAILFDDSEPHPLELALDGLVGLREASRISVLWVEY